MGSKKAIGCQESEEMEGEREIRHTADTARIADVQVYNMPERSLRRFRRSNWCHLWMDAITHAMTPCFFGGEALKVYKGHAAAVDLLVPRGMTWGEREQGEENTNIC